MDSDGSEPVTPDEVEPNPEATPASPEQQVEAEPEAGGATSAAPALPVPEAPAESEPPLPGAADGAKAARKPKTGKAADEAQQKPQPKRQGPDPAAVTRRIGTTNEDALRYVLSPDPQLSRLSRKVREALITDIPPVTAGALLGPDALARHFVASAAAGRYRDLFSLWELFRARPEACKPVLAERQRSLERARTALTTALRLGLRGRAERVAEDISRAQGLIWTWLREAVGKELEAVGRRPQAAAALLAREPDLQLPLPDEPNEEWLAEAAAARQRGPLPEPIDARLAAHSDRLPATVATLQLVAEHYPDRLDALVERVDLGSPEIGSILAWARDHGMAERVHARVRATIDAAATGDRAAALAVWQAWRERGVDVPLPQALRAQTIEGLDLAKPESAYLIAQLIDEGADIQPQAELDALAGRNRQLAEKAYEAFVCAGLDVHLPLALEGNPIVKEGTRCPACQAWTWVRPGHERRCPRRREELAHAASEAQASAPEGPP